MTWIVKLVDLQHSREITNNTLDLTLSVQQVDEFGAPVLWNPWSQYVEVRDEAKIPVPGDRAAWADPYPWADELGTFPDWKYDYRVRKVRWTQDRSGRCVYLCDIHYTSHVAYCPEPNVVRSDVVAARAADRYRDEVPTSSTQHGDAITGTNFVDVVDKPQRFTVPQIQIELVLPWRTDEAAYADGWPDMEALFADKVNKVNSAAFLGFPVRSVMFEGAYARPRRDESIDVVMSFRWDQWYHFTQEPGRDRQGNVVTALLGTPPAQHVKDVTWSDASVGSVDFTSMFSTDELGWAQSGWQYWSSACSGAEAAASYQPTEVKPLTSIRSAAP